MGKIEKLRAKVLSGTADHNIPFHDLLAFVRTLPLNERSGGKHAHIFVGTSIDGKPIFLNLQPDSNGNDSKPYQVAQVRRAIKLYGL